MVELSTPVKSWNSWNWQSKGCRFNSCPFQTYIFCIKLRFLLQQIKSFLGIAKQADWTDLNTNRVETWHIFQLLHIHAIVSLVVFSHAPCKASAIMVEYFCSLS